MTNPEYNYNNAIAQLMQRQIDKNRLLEIFEIQEGEVCGFIWDQLYTSYSKRDAEGVDNWIYLVFAYKSFCFERASLLEALITEDWHYCHENIADILKKMKQTSSVDCLYLVAKRSENCEYEYLLYDSTYALAVKCIWALGEIGSSNAIEKLKLLKLSTNETISWNAIHQLKKNGIE